jgi:phage terminase large subunit GpA-like protein
VPDEVAVIVRSVDVQGDRLETTVWGWGEGEEAGSLEYELLPGDPGTGDAVAELRRSASARTDGVRRRRCAPSSPSSTPVATTRRRCTPTKALVAQQVFAIKGASIEGAPLLSRPTRNNSAKAILYLVGSFTGKEALMRRLTSVTSPGPRYIHLPEWLDGEQIAQFTRERW